MYKMYYSGTPPYSQPVNMATLSWPPKKLSLLFFYLKNPFNMATLLIWPDSYGLWVTRLTGFHCTKTDIKIHVPPMDFGLVNIPRVGQI